jgi:hypothetical protein
MYCADAVPQESGIAKTLASSAAPARNAIARAAKIPLRLQFTL